MDGAQASEPTTLAELLEPYNLAGIGRKVGRARGTVLAWREDRVSPEAEVLPKLAIALRVDLDELKTIVARDIARRKGLAVA